MQVLRQYFTFNLPGGRYACCYRAQCECEPGEAADHLSTVVEKIFNNPDNFSLPAMNFLSREISFIENEKRFSDLIVPTVDRCRHLIERHLKSIADGSWVFDHYHLKIQKKHIPDKPNLMLDPTRKGYLVHYLNEKGEETTLTISSAGDTPKEVVERIDQLKGYLLVRQVCTEKNGLQYTLESNGRFRLYQITDQSKQLFKVDAFHDGLYSLTSFCSVYNAYREFNRFPQFLEALRGYISKEDFSVESSKKDTRKDSLWWTIYFDARPKKISKWIFSFYCRNPVNNNQIHKSSGSVKEEYCVQRLLEFTTEFLGYRKKNVIEALQKKHPDVLLEKKNSAHFRGEYALVYDEETVANTLELHYVFKNSEGIMESHPFDYNNGCAKHEIRRLFHRFKESVHEKIKNEQIIIDWDFDLKIDPQTYLNYSNNNRIRLYYVEDCPGICLLDYVQEGHLMKSNFKFSDFISQFKQLLFNQELSRFDKRLAESKGSFNFNVIQTEQGLVGKIQVKHPTVDLHQVEIKASTFVELEDALKSAFLSLRRRFKVTLSSHFVNFPCYQENHYEEIISDVWVSYSDSNAWVKFRNKKGKYYQFPISQETLKSPVNRLEEVILVLRAYSNREDGFAFNEKGNLLSIDWKCDFSVFHISYAHPNLPKKKITKSASWQNFPSLLADAHNELKKLLDLKKINDRFEPSVTLRQKTWIPFQEPTVHPEGKLALLIEWCPDDSSIRKMVEAIENNRFVIGTVKDGEQRKQFYMRLKAYLSHVIAALKDRCDPALKEYILAEIAAGAINCGGRWISEALIHYNTLVESPPNTLADFCFKVADNVKIGIIQKMVNKEPVYHNPHLYVNLCKTLIASGLGIPGAQSLSQFDDPYDDIGQVNNKKALADFMSEFNAAEISSVIEQHLNKELLEVKNPYAVPVIEAMRNRLEKNLQNLPDYIALLEAHEGNKKTINDTFVNVDVIIGRGRTGLARRIPMIEVVQNWVGVRQQQLYQECLGQLVRDMADMDDPEQEVRELSSARMAFTNKMKVLQQELLDEEGGRHRSKVMAFVDEHLAVNKLVLFGEDRLQLTQEGVVELLCELGLLTAANAPAQI